MLQKFALAFKTKTIEFFAEEEEEDADDVAASAAAGEGGLLAGQRVVVLKPDPQNPKPSGGEGEGSGEEAAVAAALATASSFQAAYLHLQAAHSPFLPEAAAAADAAAVSHLRRLSELKRHSTGPSDGSLTGHLEAQVRENQALLRSFDAVVNRLQTALDAKDSAAAALRREHAALEDSNARLASRLDRALAPPPGAGGGDAVGSMLSAGLFDSVLRDALRVAHRFTRALAELLRCAGWDLAAAAAAAYPGVVYSKHGRCRYALLSRVCLSMFDGFDSYQFGGTSDTETPEGIELAIRRNESPQQFIEHSDADPMELMNSSPDCEFAQFCDRKYKQLIHPGVESSLFGNSDCRALPVMGAAGPLYELFVAMAFRLKSLDRLLFQGIMMIFQGVIHHMNFRFVWHDKNNINMANPLSMEPAKSANSKEKSSNKKLKEIDGTAVSVGSGNSKKTMSSSGDYSAEGSSDVNDMKVSKTPRKRSLDDGPGAETAASAKMEDVLAPNHILENTAISPNHCFPAPVIKPSATNAANSRAMGTPICPTPGVMVSSHTGVSTELSIKDERELKREKRKQSNRESARRSRLRKQAGAEELATQVESLTAENTSLRSEISRLTESSKKLRSENSALMVKLKDTAAPNNVEVSLEKTAASSSPRVVENFLSMIDDTNKPGIGTHTEHGEPKLRQLLGSSPATDVVAAS